MSDSFRFAWGMAPVVLASLGVVAVTAVAVGGVGAVDSAAAAGAPAEDGVAPADRFEPNDRLTTAAAVTEGTYDLRLEAGESDYFRVSLDAEDALDVSVTNLSSDAAVRLYDAEGERVAASDELHASDERLTFAPSSGGRLYVEVRSKHEDKTTDYTLGVNVVTPAENDAFAPNDGFDTAAAVTDGRHEATIWGGESDFYAVDLAREEALDVAVTGVDTDVAVRLYDDDFEQLAASDELHASDERITLHPDSGGTFYLEVDGKHTQATTGYTLDVDVVTPAENDPFEPNWNYSLAAPTSERRGLDGRVSTPRLVGGESDFYAVGLVDGDDLTVTVSDLDADLTLALFGPSRALLASSDEMFAGDEEVTVTANGTGVHYVEVAGAGDQDTTEYVLDVDRTRAVTSDLSLYAEGGSAVPGGNVSVTFTVANAGGDTAATLSLGPLPGGWSVVDQRAPGATWNASETRWQWDALSAGTNATATVEVAVPASAPTEPRLVPAELAESGRATDVRPVRVVVGAAGERRHESGVSQALFDAVAGPDGRLDRADVLGMVSAYVRDEPVDGVALTRPNVLALVGYYARQ